MKLTELKPGDRVKIDDEGVEREGTVVRVSAEEQEVCIDNGIQEFWYSLDHVRGIPVTPERLLGLGFEKMDTDRGVKYGKGPFRVWTPSEDFSTVEAWYREDHRFFDRPLMVHELQNIHIDMTKVALGD